VNGIDLNKSDTCWCGKYRFKGA